ncbi:glycosyltransferase family 2 protein [Aestuariivita boseongensis]|uniref:glycosyltransferase family 2 protein n=1 Tax=Aestuariivita boseongensis TaxID=1470562 RepID=UPI000680992D|nr:glycosyltransferase family 2 protein [Aestuariivita boseongensis]
MSEPTLLTVILNYKTPEMTLKAAAAALREMKDIAGEILIVDNDSQDGSFDYLAENAQLRGWTKSGRVRVIASGHNGGFGAGNNFAIRQGLSTGQAPDYVYLLNSDAFVDPGAIRTLLEFMQAHPQVGFAGSQVRGDDDVPHTTHFRFPSIAGEFEASIKLGLVTRALKNAVVPMAATDVPVKADWVAGASLMIRSRMLDEIGLFDETYFLYFEETDLCLRGAQAGWETWFVPQSTAVHIGSVSTGMKTWTRAPRYWFDSRRHYFLKNHGRVYLIGASLARIAGGLLWRARRVISPRPLGEPPRFLRDFVTHAIRANLPGRRPRVPKPYSQGLPSHRFAKDSK